MGGTVTKILAIDTSCDETSGAVTEGSRVLSNILWSQASLHSKWGGVVPSLAKRAHQERIGWVINRALKVSKLTPSEVDAIAVTVGPGLAIALEVGIQKAKELAMKYNKPLITVNHVEGHILSVFAETPKHKVNISFPAIALVLSGKHSDIVLVKDFGSYEIIAYTIDDALGEALDKAARMLGLGYPGGAILEKMAKMGNANKYGLPIPMMGKESRFVFSYSGLKSAMWRLVENEKPLTKEKIYDLAASFQDKAFKHVERLLIKVLDKYKASDFLFGGGVSANLEIRKCIRGLCKERGVKFHIPYTKNTCGDNAAMIGVASYFKYKKELFVKPNDLDEVERIPRARVDSLFPWEH